MTTITSIQNLNVKNQTRGRKTSNKTAKIRRSVIRALMMAKSEGQVLTTKEIAKVSKQKKTAVIAALRWAEQNDMVSRVGTEKHEGRGRPMVVWSI